MTDLFGKLPEVEFCDADADAVVQSVILAYEGLTGLKLYPGDPVRYFLSTLASIIVSQRAIINGTGKQNLLFYAAGKVLDHLGVLTGVERLPAAAATTTLRFSRPAPGDAVLIPAGALVGPDKKLFFSSVETVDMAADETAVEVMARCTEAGVVGNGFLPGQLTEWAAPIAGLTVTNVTETSNGAEIESDESFRVRISLSPERYSTAGTRGGYEFWAMTAHQDIVDVAVRSPEPGVVEVFPLLAGGQLPDQAVLDLVDATLSSEKVIPITDDVRVSSPVIVESSVDIVWFAPAKDSALAGTIQTSVATAVEAYVSWQTTALGRDLNPTELIYRVKAAGAIRLEVTAPERQVLDVFQVARMTSVNVRYGGLEDE